PRTIPIRAPVRSLSRGTISTPTRDSSEFESASAEQRAFVLRPWQRAAQREHASADLSPGCDILANRPPVATGIAPRMTHRVVTSCYSRQISDAGENGYEAATDRLSNAPRCRRDSPNSCAARQA